ncbi:unnamed protein product [Rhizophagus irregularis]|nr:unnamed protein product [Rhizophagus irregularis]
MFPPPPRPIASLPSGDRSLSPDNSAGAPNKRTRTVSADDMDVEPTTTTTAFWPCFWPCVYSPLWPSCSIKSPL